MMLCPHHSQDSFDYPSRSPLPSYFDPTPADAVSLATRSPAVQLNFANLAIYEQVGDQYQSKGVRFEGAIAIQPSNPAFGACYGAIALIPMSGRSKIMAHFCSPRKQVQASLTGARQVRVTAYNHNNDVVTRQCSEGTRSRSSVMEQAEAFPNHQMVIKGEGIAKIVIDSDAPFVLDRFAYN